MKNLSLYVFIFLLGIGFAQAVYYYPIMPEVMASHFGGSGEADATMYRSNFFLMHTVIALGVSGVFSVLPWLFEKYRVTKFNMPNMEYWSKPENLDEFYTFFRGSMMWFGVGQLILLIGIIQLVFEANLTPNPVLNNKIAVGLLIAFLIFVVVWLIAFFIRARGKS